MKIDDFTNKIKFLKCRSFFPEYCGIRYTSGILRKLSRRNANGNAGSFSAEQKEQIIAGVAKFLEELKLNK